MSSLVTDLASGLPSTLFTPHHQDRHDSHELVLGLSRADLPPTHEVKAGLLEVGTHSLYEPREIEPDQLPDAISRIRDGRSFVHIEGAVAIQYVDPSGGVTKLSGNDLAIGEAHFPLYYGDVVRRPDQCSRDKNSGISFFSLSELAHNSRYIDGACLGIRMGDEVKLHRARVLENNGTRTVIVPIASGERESNLVIELGPDTNLFSYGRTNNSIGTLCQYLNREFGYDFSFAPRDEPDRPHYAGVNSLRQEFELTDGLQASVWLSEVRNRTEGGCTNIAIRFNTDVTAKELSAHLGFEVRKIDPDKVTLHLNATSLEVPQILERLQTFRSVTVEPESELDIAAQVPAPDVDLEFELIDIIEERGVDNTSATRIDPKVITKPELEELAANLSNGRGVLVVRDIASATCFSALERVVDTYIRTFPDDLETQVSLPADLLVIGRDRLVGANGTKESFGIEAFNDGNPDTQRLIGIDQAKFRVAIRPERGETFDGKSVLSIDIYSGDQATRVTLSADKFEYREITEGAPARLFEAELAAAGFRFDSKSEFPANPVFAQLGMHPSQASNVVGIGELTVGKGNFVANYSVLPHGDVRFLLQLIDVNDNDAMTTLKGAAAEISGANFVEAPGIASVTLRDVRAAKQFFENLRLLQAA